LAIQFSLDAGICQRKFTACGDDQRTVVHSIAREEQAPRIHAPTRAGPQAVTEGAVVAVADRPVIRGRASNFRQQFGREAVIVWPDGIAQD
jgi:hypothetical protein